MRYDVPVIETTRCYLRALEESDACDMFAYYHDKEVTRYLSMTPHACVDETLHIMQRVRLPYMEQQDFETWVIILKENDKLIGDIQFHSIEEDRAQLAYVLSKEYWNQGILQEILQEVLRIGFTWCGLRRIEALYEKDNVASGRVLSHSGFQVEGHLRQYTKLGDNKYHDMVLAAILKNEWIGENNDEKRTKSEI